MADAATAEMICPKCGGSMRSYERNGITIETCTECRGVFLDRGELERLIEAEGAAMNAVAAPSGSRDQGGGHGADPSGRRKRSGFLGDLFEFGG